VRGGRKSIVIMLSVLGAIIGLLVPIIIDLLDSRIKTAGQVEKLLGYKPLAALLAAGQQGVSEQAIADQKRRLALALNRERLRTGKASSLILMTSVTHGSSVSSLALDLASDMNAMDIRAIVVEVNTLKPDSRYVSETITTGVIDLIVNGDTELEHAINPANAQYPDRIALGLFEEGLLFGYHRLQVVLERLAESYSIIILDAAPILLSADVEYFSSISDITLLIIAAQETKPGEMQRAVQLLERVDPKVISFVVTRLQIFKGGGYYSQIYQHVKK
jgi:Mrp family chromosome partitioning ATPase